jgi:diguanylate cyclase (GGDEF)-like protein
MGKAPDLSERSEQLQVQIQSLSGRDFQLWSIALLVILVLMAGFAALIAPNMVWKAQLLHTDARYFPQLFFGLISLVLLFNIYVVGQKRELNSTRKALIRELVFNERLENLSLVDPLTQLYNRRALEQMLGKEVTRANRQGTPLSVVLLDMDNFKNLNEELGNQAGDEFLVMTSKLLRATFRGSDNVFRYGGDEFIVVMPETTETQAEHALKRLSAAVERWNLETRPRRELALSWGLGSHVIGSSATDLLQTANRKMFLKKHNLVPVF